jgi:hypothetical protein
MRTIVPAIVAGLVVSLSIPAFAGDASGTTTQPVAVQPVTAQPASATTQPAGEKVSCKPIAHEGMLVKTNACHTQQEWDAIRHRQEHEVADFQNRNYQTSGGK